MSKQRVAVAVLAFSMAGFVATTQHEGWTDKAVIPVDGDRWTVGPGLTMREDGTPVQPGDTITHAEGIRRSAAHIQRDETGLKRCVTGELTQKEYDILVDFAYQFGVPTACKSSVVRNINAGNYAQACESYLNFRKVAGRDCSLAENWGPRGCRGVWLRAQSRKADCMGEQ